jgi:hypothetical protein
MSMEPGNLISHNYFNDLSRNGVFAFRNQGGNVVEYNHIHNAMQTTIDGACIHFATMNHLNAPNFILNNWLYDAWGYEQKPDGKPVRKLGNGIFLDWDTSNTTVRDNWIYNSVGGAIKPIWNNQNLVIENNRESDTRIVPPFEKDLGPGGKGHQWHRPRLEPPHRQRDPLQGQKACRDHRHLETPKPSTACGGCSASTSWSAPPPFHRKPATRCPSRQTGSIRFPCSIPPARTAPATCPSPSSMPTARRT